MKKVIAAVLLVALTASLAFAASDKQIKAMSLFLSNFTELGYMNVTADYMSDPLNIGDAVHFGVWHNYVNNFKSRIKSCGKKNCQYGSLTIDAKFVSETLKKYLDIDFKNSSEINEFDTSYYFDGKLYHFEGADGEAVYYAKVNDVTGPDKNGIYDASGIVYNVDDTSDVLGTFNAKFKDHKFRGKNTYALIELMME